MTDQPKPTSQDDDVEAHMPFRARRDEEAPTEKPTGSEPAHDTDDVERHGGKFRYTAEQAPPDVEGHGRFRFPRDDEAPIEKPTGTETGNDADDDVEGHAT